MKIVEKTAHQERGGGQEAVSMYIMKGQSLNLQAGRSFKKCSGRKLILPNPVKIQTYLRGLFLFNC